MRVVLVVVIALCWLFIGIFAGTQLESQKWHKYWDQVLASGVGYRLGPVPTNRGIDVCAKKGSHLFGLMWFYKSPPPTWIAMCMNGHAYDLAGIELHDEPSR